MRTRIRTVKPEFFRHEELYRLEKVTGMPMRIAFEGLWVCADKAGRFKWEPNQLKLDIMPWDEVDFAVVLEKLREAGFIVRYEIGNKQYGFIPTWREHQLINKKEAESRLPAPPPVNSGESPGNSPELPGDSEEFTGTTGVEGEWELEGELELEGEGNEAAPTGAPPAPNLVDLWNLNAAVLPPIRALTKKRHDQWRRRWAENPDEGYWVAIVVRMAASPFCRGENDRGWKANVDFLLRPETHVKVSEGQYDPGPAQRRKTRAQEISDSNQALYDAVERGEA